jgi:asparagine synthase (glutamine-hydrolysing)
MPDPLGPDLPLHAPTCVQDASIKLVCGVVGILRFDGDEVGRDTVARMTASLPHRGPDDEGCWHTAGVGLGHRRLSVIDLAGSHQPMSSADGRWTITFNGEIFNYRDLRTALDYPFRTDGDTETILAGLTVHGIDFLTRLVGQFAFAAFDRSKGVVHLVRDRLGVLPMHYRHEGDRLLFASEVKAILAGMGQRPSVDLQSLDAYLAGRSVPAPHTLFSGVRKVLPGHRVEVHLDTGKMQEIRYWWPPEEEGRIWPPQEAVSAVDEALTDAVAASLVADVPVGAYLSGGVDSSLIVAKAAQLHRRGRLRTFAAGFGDPRHDELPFARQVSQLFGTEHREVLIDASDFEELWPTLTWHRDAPMSEPADFAVYRLAQAAREEVTVVLSGEGSDELFGGYPKYRAARAMAALSRVPGGLRQAVGGAVDRRLPERLARLRIAARVWGTPDPGEQHRSWFSPFTVSERAGLLAGVPTRAVTGNAPVDDPVRAMLLADLGGWLPDNLLERGDRMSMATSLELRPPFLDHRLVELAFRLPSDVKVRSGETKWVLKEVARRHLPSVVVDRPKVGFRVPLDAWFRTSLRDTVRHRLTAPGGFVADTLDRSMVRELLDRHDSGSFNEDIRIWTLMSLEVWHETFFRSPA